MSARRGDWFLSISGRQLWPLDLRPEDVDINEIAHSLSMLCRFNGHCREFYSVAQHSILVATQLPPDLSFQGLLHDATEAYVGDMIRPLKRSMPEYRKAEDAVWEAIAARFDLPVALAPEVKVADNRMLQTERRDLLAPHTWAWMEDQIADPSTYPYAFHVTGWSPETARETFLAHFSDYSTAYARRVAA